MIKPYFFHGQTRYSNHPGNRIRIAAILFFRAEAQKINNTGGDN